MREAKVVRTGAIEPAQVEVGKRLRPIGEKGVQAVLASYDELGVIKDPIDLRQMKGGKMPKLIAGGHRLEAARRLGIDVPYKLWDCTTDWALMCEIDDNLAGAGLCPLDAALFLAERKKVFDRVHPEKRRGVAGASARWDASGNLPVASFATSSAEAMACDESAIYKLLKAGLALSADEVRWLRSMPSAVTRADLEALSKIGDVHERSQVCIALANGTAKNAAAARRAYAVERGDKPPVKSPNEASLQRLLDAWDRAPKAVRDVFVRERFDALSDLVSDEYERREM